MHIRDLSTGETHETQFHAATISQSFDAICEKRAELSAVSVPFGVRGTLERRQGDAPSQQLMEIYEDAGVDCDSECWQLSDQQIEMIAEALADYDSDFVLSFGTFGRYIRRARERQVKPTVVFPLSLRRRILWYCAANAAVARIRKHAQMSDAQLIDLFNDIRPRPQFAALRNALRSQLTKLYLRIPQ